MDEYLELSIRTDRKTEKKKSYETLERRLTQTHNAHFAMMTQPEEVIEANQVLRKMIRERKRLIGAREKTKYAPNCRELQKLSSELNKF